MASRSCFQPDSGREDARDPGAASSSSDPASTPVTAASGALNRYASGAGEHADV